MIMQLWVSGHSRLLSHTHVVSGTPVYIMGLGTIFYIFCHLVHAFLSIKGVKCKAMGCMGDIDSWIATVFNATLSGCVIGCETLGRDEEASPPSYHVSCLL